MTKIKTYPEFLNEIEIPTGITNVSQILQWGEAQARANAAKGESGETTADNTIGADEVMGTANGTYKPVGKYSVVGGNDDFVLYMQHQQGQAGAAGLVKAASGKGALNKDTIATKGGVKYANLVGNIPSDKPQVKKDIIAALDSGDHQIAASMFLAVWKEKWFRHMQSAKLAIEKSENRNVKQVIVKFANKYGVPFDFAITVAMIESGLNPNAHNNRYKGLFAMDPNDSYGGLSYKMGNRWNEPEVNADAGLRLISNQIKTFKKQVGTEAYATLKMGSWVNNIA